MVLEQLQPEQSTVDVIRAVEVLHEQDFGGALVEPREGKVILFHEAHMPVETGSYASTDVTT